MQSSKAIVTLAIGNRHLKRWKNLCQSNWQAYASKHGYDLICIDTPLDDSLRATRRSPAWQKCLVLSQDFAKQYERIVWIDCDVLINSTSAPCISKDIPIEKVGAVNAWLSPTPELFRVVMARQEELWGNSGIIGSPTAEEYYTSYGIQEGLGEVVQTGVMVLSPKYHRLLLEKVYFYYEDKGGAEWHYEMRPLSYELLKSGVVNWIDRRFNSIWAMDKILYYPFLFDRTLHKNNICDLVQQKYLAAKHIARQMTCGRRCATAALFNSYFLHFAGYAHEMWLVDSLASSCFGSG